MRREEISKVLYSSVCHSLNGGVGLRKAKRILETARCVRFYITAAKKKADYILRQKRRRRGEVRCVLRPEFGLVVDWVRDETDA